MFFRLDELLCSLRENETNRARKINNPFLTQVHAEPQCKTLISVLIVLTVQPTSYNGDLILDV